MEKFVESKFLMFENKKNNCWLDACVALVAHNRTFRKIVHSAPKSQINKIITTYDDAVSILNDPGRGVDERLKRTEEMLVEIQDSTLSYLQKFLKQKAGVPDSAFCAVLNLIRHDISTIKEQLSVGYVWKKYCTECGTHSRTVFRDKPILTLPTVDRFEPESPTSMFTCSCKKEQEMKLFYRDLPPCLLFHFENGAGNTNDLPVVFSLKERKYQLTAVVILEKSSDPNVNHFVTWIRDPFVNMWLDCNDLNTDLVSFSCKQPEYNIKDVYMYVFESFDNLGKIPHETSLDQDLDDENVNVEVIDISDESEEAQYESENIFPKYLHEGNAETNSVQNTTNYLDVDQGKRDATSATATTKSLLTGKEIKEQIIAHTVKKETAVSTVIDYGNVPVSNIRFTKNRKSAGLFKHAYESEFNRCVKGELENVKIKTEVIDPDYSDSKYISTLDGKSSIINNVTTDIKLEKDDISSLHRKLAESQLTGNEKKNVLGSNSKVDSKEKKMFTEGKHSFPHSKKLVKDFEDEHKETLHSKNETTHFQHTAAKSQLKHESEEKKMFKEGMHLLQQSKSLVKDFGNEHKETSHSKNETTTHFQHTAAKSQLKKESEEKPLFGCDSEISHSRSRHNSLNATSKESCVEKSFGRKCNQQLSKASQDCAAELTTKSIKHDSSIATSKREMLNETQQASSNAELGAAASETVTQNSSSRKKRKNSKCNKMGEPKGNGGKGKEDGGAKDEEMEKLIEEGVECAFAAFIEQFCFIKRHEEGAN